MKKFPIALQPFTIREELASNYEGALRRVASIGFQHIEIGKPPASTGLTVHDLKALLNSLGLQVVGTHAGFDTLDFDPDSIMEFLQVVNGWKHVAISLRFDSRDSVLRKAEQMNRIGEQFKKGGYQFLYHNHDWEFVTFDGEYAMDLLLKETDPELVQMELDTYWVKKGGEDPAEYMRTRLQNRCPLLHIKDVEHGDEQFFAEIGEGILDFEEIARAAEEIGVNCMVVEQDQTRRTPFESLELSLANLRNMSFAAL